MTSKYILQSSNICFSDSFYYRHSFTEREAYTMENIDNILDSADSPLEVSI